MICHICHKEIPSGSSFCLHCGTAQLQSLLKDSSNLQTATNNQVADSSKPARPEIDWLAREERLANPDFDYEAQRQFGGIVDRGIGCLMLLFAWVMGLAMLVPGVPLMAIFGLPLAVILAPLTYFNVGDLQTRLRGNKFLQKLPGFTSGQPLVLALSVFLYLAGLALLCYFLLTFRH